MCVRMLNKKSNRADIVMCRKSDCSGGKMKKIQKLVISSLFAAFACAATFISIPLPVGYANCGDIIVLLGAFLLGPVYGPLAAGIGTAFADFLMGYVAYVPGTFLIKALMVLVAVSLYTFLSSRRCHSAVSYSVGAVAAELIMVSGYYLYESLCLGYGFGGAIVSVPGNLLQGVVGASAAVLLINLLKRLMGKYKF